MVVEWIMSIAVEFVGWVVALFPQWDVPAWLLDVDDVANQILAGLTGLGAWVNWGLLFACFALQLTTFLVCLGIKGLMKLAAHFPQFGGSG